MNIRVSTTQPCSCFACLIVDLVWQTAYELATASCLQAFRSTGKSKYDVITFGLIISNVSHQIRICVFSMYTHLNFDLYMLLYSLYTLYL